MQFPFALPSVMKLPEFKEYPAPESPPSPSFVSDIENPKCYAYYNKIRDIKLNFTPLTLATAIMHITENIDKNNLKNTSGISWFPLLLSLLHQ